MGTRNFNFATIFNCVLGYCLCFSTLEAYMADLPRVNYTIADAVKTDVTYQLFENNSNDGTYVDEDTIKKADISKTTPLKLVIHGWLSNETSYWYQPIRDEYFMKGEHNVIYIDWSKAGSKEYEIAAANTKPVGHFIGDFILASGVNLDRVHVIGHSLGSHVAGFIGKHIFEKTGRKIGRITATDPAAPGFEHPDVSETDRVSKSDAEFVDVVHSDMGHYGFVKPIGTVDFYPNGGGFQLGCPPYEEDDNCSHARSNLYFIESVNSDAFKARKCPSWEEYVNGKCNDNDAIVFGENVPKTACGVYFFATNSEPPFGKCKK